MPQRGHLVRAGGADVGVHRADVVAGSGAGLGDEEDREGEDRKQPGHD